LSEPVLSASVHEMGSAALRSVEGLLGALALVVGLVSAVVLLVGVVKALLSTARWELSAAGRGDRRDAVRRELGQYLLLGLELLVAADVLETIVTPSLEHVLQLGGVVLIRTIIVVSLHWELSRHEAAGHGTAAMAARPRTTTA
jgi:uncharacterized membrane protein